MESPEIKRGYIIKLAKRRGYGFIRQDDGSNIFFHVTGVIRPAFEELREGAKVEYMVTSGIHSRHKGNTKAIGVMVV